MKEWTTVAQELTDQIQRNLNLSQSLSVHESREDLPSQIKREIANMPELSPACRIRLEEEFLGVGPLISLMNDPDVTEITLQSEACIGFERKGLFVTHNDQFVSSWTYQMFVERLLIESQLRCDLGRPFDCGPWRGFRLHITHPSVTTGSYSLCFRRQRQRIWDLEDLRAMDWTDQEGYDQLVQMIERKENFLIVGPTGVGKTSVLEALLRKTGSNCRCLILEDTSELPIPNLVSLKLLGRQSDEGTIPSISLSRLLREALRLRPDRLIVGEVRGEEAKDLLLSLSTGHQGSFGTLHAETSRQALSRLEMLVQMGAPQWNFQTVRRLLQESLQKIVVLTKNAEGKRMLKEISRLSSLEETGFLLESVYARST